MTIKCFSSSLRGVSRRGDSGRGDWRLWSLVSLKDYKWKFLFSVRPKIINSPINGEIHLFPTSLLKVISIQLVPQQYYTLRIQSFFVPNKRR